MPVTKFGPRERNLSPAQFKNRSLVSSVIAALSESGLAANRLELEITESVLLQ
jgi:EAL domain-containing protein (putative c-di-GMP-specific phosphodiesterase class I)